jgi:hypothetical protein
VGGTEQGRVENRFGMGGVRGGSDGTWRKNNLQTKRFITLVSDELSSQETAWDEGSAFQAGFMWEPTMIFLTVGTIAASLPYFAFGDSQHILV